MKIFDSIKITRPRVNKFDLSHERKMSLRMGKLIPMFIQDVVPGDRFRVKSEIFLRMAPMIAPIMHRVNVYTHYFFVPNRLVWNEWEDFITGGPDGDLAPVPPYFTINDVNVDTGMFDIGTLADYMGLPMLPAAFNIDPNNETRVSALPFRAYQKIYDEYYRDQNLSSSLDIDLSSGDVAGAEFSKIMTLRSRAWEKDYFTSALPFAQRGGEVSVPFDSVVDEVYSTTTGQKLTSGPGTIEYDIQGDLVAQDSIPRDAELRGSTGNLSINELRRSVRLQEWLEKNARGGYRYVEQILSHFGVKSSDARLQRPEYLGGGRSPVVISEVLQTAQDATEPLATMAGHGVSVGNTNGFKRFFEEHGFVIGIMSVLPKTAYMQGIPRMFTREDKFDYFWPEFANIGEQEVKLKEVLYSGAAVTERPDDTFGYQSRYCEYKYGINTIHGEFKTTLAHWHLGRIFGAIPVLNEEFVTADPSDRIFPVADEEHMYCQLWNRVDALRPMPYYGTPTL